MRYYVIALTLVVGFMTGFFIPVVSDVFVNRRAQAPADSGCGPRDARRSDRANDRTSDHS
jgi:hypothetical protein